MLTMGRRPAGLRRLGARGNGLGMDGAAAAAALGPALRAMTGLVDLQVR